MNECFVSSGISGKRKERIRRDVITYSIERGRRGRSPKECAEIRKKHS